ncbi:microtubule integrity protein mal3 [Taxawa tesnikishii (nom. ined.)]|nr:microtubule integrity protein mal3 [Dothideales sp. JES 119]
MGESRQELLAWINSLLQLNLTKVEQCGTGYDRGWQKELETNKADICFRRAALCQVYDSIFLDVPMSRVKFNANAEYAYLDNFKILSNVFRKHQIERPIPVEQLVKCKMQDNLEFLQWTKRYWDQYYPGGDYDPIARRKGQAVSGGAPASMRSSTTSAARRPAAGATATVTATAGAARTRTPMGGGVSSAATARLNEENAALKETVQGLERERDFYFSKLRDIELLVQGAMEEQPELEKDEGGLLRQIQTILYSTEVSDQKQRNLKNATRVLTRMLQEGFEIPAEAEGEVPEEETF